MFAPRVTWALTPSDVDQPSRSYAFDGGKPTAFSDRGGGDGALLMAPRSLYIRAMAEHMIYHLARAEQWRAAERAGVYHGTDEDTADGFLHFSTAAQVVESARKHRAGERDIILLTVAADDLGTALRWEPARGGDLFPHLYGPLAIDAVRAAASLPLGPDGLHRFPPLDDKR